MMGNKDEIESHWSFIGVVYAFFIVMSATTLPTPLYPIYGDAFELSALMITFIYAAYAVGVMVALLVFGHLSDRMGRKNILAPGIMLSAVSSLVFLFAGGIPTLFMGRLLSGLSAGLFTSTATATLVDLAPQHKREQASMVASGVNMLGLGLGPLLAGMLAQYFSFPMRLVFGVNLLLLIPAAIAVWMMPEPVKVKRKGILKIQPLHVPMEVRATFIRAVTPVFAGFSVLGLFTAVSPTFLQEVLHVDHKAVLGLLVFSIYCASAGGQLLWTNLPDRLVLSWGSVMLMIGILLVGVALYARSFTLLLIGAVVSGGGQAFSFRAGLASVNAETTATERAEVISSFFMVVYIAVSIPVIGVGLLAKWVGIQVAGITFSVGIAMLALMAFVLSLMRHSADERH